MGLFDFGSSRSTSSNTSTSVALDSYNRTFNNVNNIADSNNLAIAVGPGGDPFAKSGDSVQHTALKAAAAVLSLALIAWAVSRKASRQ